MRVASVQPFYIFPCVTVFAVVGAFTANQSLTDVMILLVFTLVGYGMRLVSLNPAAFIIGFILMPLLEQNLDQAVSIVGADYLRLLASPVGWIFITLSVLSVGSAIRSNRATRRQAEQIAPETEQPFTLPSNRETIS